jgi:hypothetical protein
MGVFCRFCPFFADQAEMTEKHLITAASCLRSARLFNLLAIATTLLAASLFGLGR